MKKLLFMLLCLALLAGCDKNNETNKGAVYGETFVETVSGLDMKMIFVEGGAFSMGATAEQEDDANDCDSPNEYPVRAITLDSFYIAECEVTQSQWRKVMGSNPSCSEGEDLPVENVSWNDAKEFCEKLSELTGRKYMLPTEAQWEYAARGGKKSKGFKYSGSNDSDDVAWHFYNSDNSIHSVKTKLPNELGLYDMSGNALEWCQDRYRNKYDESDTINPAGPSSGSSRVRRGGSWFADVRDCRVSSRGGEAADYRDSGSGFRVALIP